jgi:hypothetical protein
MIGTSNDWFRLTACAGPFAEICAIGVSVMVGVALGWPFDVAVWVGEGVDVGVMVEVKVGVTVACPFGVSVRVGVNVDVAVYVTVNVLEAVT